MRRFDYWDKFPLHEIDYSDWENSIALFGDSTTYGQGLADEYRLHNQIDTERTINNFGYPSHSNEHIFKKMVDIFTNHGFPRAVIIGWTSTKRMAVINEEEYNIHPLGPWMEEGKGGVDLFRLLAVSYPSTMISKTEDIIKATRLMCQNRCILKEWTVFDMPFMVDNEDSGIYYQEKIDIADDGCHSGKETIKQLCKHIGRI